ncbi:MAG: alpha/beta fold hydrolase [Planctomycetota bacterium]|nr:alpha/beta fold hydrolase [Planctomycetota bacterium]
MNLALGIALTLSLQSGDPSFAEEIYPPLNARLEVLTRLRELERAWMVPRDPQFHAEALRSLEGLAESCFSSGTGACARRLDRALMALTPHGGRDGYFNLGLVLSSRLCDRADGTTFISAEAVYSTTPTMMQLGCTLPEVGGVAVHEDTEETWILSFPVPLNLRRANCGDVPMQVSLWPGSYTVPLTTVQISIVERRDERLAALAKDIEGAREKAPKLELETAAMLHGLLTSLAKGSTEAHDYPGARLLAEAEQVVAAARKGERWYGPERDGEFFLALPTAKSNVRTRVFVPSGLTRDKPAPLVLGLHGRAFDEDTWFDGYGCGQSVKLARERGWLFAAPRCDGTETAADLTEFVRALGTVYPIDPTRVLLVGHSRGGGTALTALAESPTTFRAVAAIGAALAPSRASELNQRPLFLAVGDRDFARASVEALHTALVAVEHHHTTFRLYPNTEHWLCPTDSLPDVFTWFDSQLR